MCFCFRALQRFFYIFVYLLFIRYNYCIPFIVTLIINSGDFTFVFRATYKPVFRVWGLIWAFDISSSPFGGSLHLFLLSWSFNWLSNKISNNFSQVLKDDAYSCIQVFNLSCLDIFGSNVSFLLLILFWFCCSVELMLFLFISNSLFCS